MNDQIDRDLEQRLAAAFRGRDLPAAPASLVETLERVPDADVRSVAGRGVTGTSGRSRSTGRTLGLLGLAAVLAVGGILALTGGARPPQPEPGRSPAASPAPAAAAVSTYRVEWTAATPADPATLARLLEIVRGRLEASGGSGATVRAEGTDRIVVEMPVDLDADALRRVVPQRGEIAFVPLGDVALEAGDEVDLAAFPPLFGAEAIQEARVDTGQVGQRVVQFQLRPAQAEAFRAYTADHVGSFFAIAIDGAVISAPRIESEIPGGSVEITKNGVEGGFGPLEARTLAAFLTLGPIPVGLTEISYVPIGGDPSADPAARTFPLRRAASPPFCSLVASPYRSFEIRIDPAAVEPVMAITDTGAQVPVLWGASFIGRVGPPPVVVDGNGAAIGDGTRVTAEGDAISVNGHDICVDSASISIWDQVVASPRPSPATFELERIVGDVGCDTILPPYVGFSLQIDPSAERPVQAATESGLRLPVFFGSEFRGSVGPPPVVIDGRSHAYDASTYVRVRDVREHPGSSIVDGGIPALGDHFVCPAPDAVYIFNEPPPS